MEKPDGCQIAERNKDIKDREVNPVADRRQEMTTYEHTP